MKFEVILPSDVVWNKLLGLSNNKAPETASVPEDSVQMNFRKPSQLWFLFVVSSFAMHLYPNSLGYSMKGHRLPSLLWSVPGTIRPWGLCNEDEDRGDGESDLSELHDSWGFPDFKIPANHFLWHIVNPAEMSFNSHKNLLLGTTIV